MVSRRLGRLPLHTLDGDLRVFEAATFRARLLGLATLPKLEPGHALLLRRCRAVHTIGMRFALDLLFLDAEGRVAHLARDVAPGSFVRYDGASAVIEARAGEGGRFARAIGSCPMAAQQPERKLLAALNPRVPLYRDSYNEYFVFVLSAGGAAAGTQVPLYIVMAITGIWSVGVFVAACVVFELAVIFGVARPQMKPVERLGWVALWGAATAVLALAFYYLVAESTL